MGKDVIVACDMPDKGSVMAFLERFGDERPYIKIGMELFYAEGPQVVRELKERGHSIFLDLKLCDIPNTVRGAMRSLRPLGVDIINLHAFGGGDMMRAAAEGLTDENGERHTKLIAVTILTSTSEDVLRRELLIDTPLSDTCIAYAKNAKSAGLDGVVCSPLESLVVHEHCGEGFLTVTPGVRFAGGERGDQVRVTTPERARELGSDYIVMGRPITGADDPVAAWKRARAEFCGGDM